MDIVKVQTVDPVQLADSELGSMDCGQLLVAYNEIKDAWTKLHEAAVKASEELQKEIDKIQEDIDSGTLSPEQVAAKQREKAEKAAAKSYQDTTAAGMSDSSQSIDVSCYVPAVFRNSYTVKVQDFQPPQSAAPELSAVLSGSVLAVVKKLRDETKWAQQR